MKMHFGLLAFAAALSTSIAPAHAEGDKILDGNPRRSVLFVPLPPKVEVPDQIPDVIYGPPSGTVTGFVNFTNDAAIAPGDGQTLSSVGIGTRIPGFMADKKSGKLVMGDLMAQFEVGAHKNPQASEVGVSGYLGVIEGRFFGQGNGLHPYTGGGLELGGSLFGPRTQSEVYIGAMGEAGVAMIGDHSAFVIGPHVVLGELTVGAKDSDDQMPGGSKSSFGNAAVSIKGGGHATFDIDRRLIISAKALTEVFAGRVIHSVGVSDKQTELHGTVAVAPFKDKYIFIGADASLQHWYDKGVTATDTGSPTGRPVINDDLEDVKSLSVFVGGALP